MGAGSRGGGEGGAVLDQGNGNVNGIFHREDAEDAEAPLSFEALRVVPGEATFFFI